MDLNAATNLPLVLGEGGDEKVLPQVITVESDLFYKQNIYIVALEIVKNLSRADFRSTSHLKRFCGPSTFTQACPFN